MKKMFVLAIIMICINLVNLSALKGTGNVMSEERNVSIFHSLRFDCIGNVIINEGKPGLLKVTTDANIMPLISTEVDEKGVLVIKTTKLVTEANKLEVIVTMDTIQELFVSGSGKIDVLKKINEEKVSFKVQGSGNIRTDVTSKFVYSKITGSGSIDLSGTTIKHDIDINGSGEVNALNLITEDITISVAGSGLGKVKASNMLEIELIGGNVEYSGHPKINLNAAKIGGGSLKYLD